MEIGTLWTCRGGSLEEVAARATAVQGQSPLSYVALAGWLRVVGESPGTLRLPSALVGTLACGLAGLGAAWGFGRRAGAVALLLAATDPALVGHARDARPYALAQAATLLAWVGVARASRSGRARDRALAWGGAVLAVYAHTLFVPVLGACALALASTVRREQRPRLALEGILAALALAPLVPQAVSLAQRREQLAWVESVDPRVLLTVLAPEHRWPLGLALVWLVVAGRRAAASRWRARGNSGVSVRFLASAAVGSIGLVLALTALGSNAVAGRYLALAQVALVPLVAWALASVPRALGAALVVLAAALGIAHAPVTPRSPQSWSSAAAALDTLAPPSSEPVLLASPFVEVEQVETAAGLSPGLRSFVAAPLEVRPGAREPGRDYVLIPAAWLAPYLETVVAPRLESARGFTFVGSRSRADAFEKWLDLRFAGRFRSRVVLDGDPVVDRYERR